MKKKILYLFMAFIMCLEPINLIAQIGNNEKQIKKIGGCNSNTDGINICKTISPTNIENYFDITLKVQTKSVAQEILKSQDLAIVIVMDISNTMKTYGIDGVLYSTGPKRLEVAQDAAETFIDSFTQSARESNGAIRELGFVAFNTDALEIFNLNQYTKNKADTYASTLKKKMKDETNKIINQKYNNAFDKKNNNTTSPVSYGSSYKRFTNIEAGLRRGRDMVNSSKAKNRYIIFISDGFPTTYSNMKKDTLGYDAKGYLGYNVYMNDRNEFYNRYKQDPPVSKEGIFYNELKGVYCTAGVNYSDEAARRAKNVAYTIKNEGTKIFSIGVGLNNQQQITNDYLSDINRKQYENNQNRYEIGNDTADFKKWLGREIGSGYSSNPEENYYSDSYNLEALKDVYNKIFKKIKELASEEAKATWVIEDPMNNINDNNKFIEFIGLYDDKNKLKDKLINGNPDESDTANYSGDTLKWDLKNSTYTGPTETIINGKIEKIYTYEVKYRVRIKNEQNGFVPSQPYNTNGETKLTYVIRTNTGAISDPKMLTFPIPQVEGYLGKLEFYKISKYLNKPLSGIKFEIIHDPSCACLNERKHMSESFNRISVSNNEGKVIFDKIPSGHKYILHEIETDEYHELDKTEYKFEVSYGNTNPNFTNKQITNNYKTKNLTIEKKLDGTTSDESFKFVINAKYQGENLTGKYITIINDKEEEREFIEGKLEISLKDNEKIIIKNLPYGTKITVEEIDREGFTVKHNINSAKAVYSYNTEEITLDNDVNILFTNMSGYQLPATGSAGMLILLIIGSLLMVIPIIYIIKNALEEKADY